MDVLETRFMTDIVITAAKRTPVGSFLGAFAATPAHELGRVAIEAAMAQAGITGEDVSEVIMGQVLTAGQGQNPARQAAMAAGIPQEIPAWGVNRSEEHTSELQSLMRNSYAVFCLKKTTRKQLS